MTNPNPSSTSDRTLNRPQHPSQSTSGGDTKTPTPEQSALAVSTALAHGLRTSLNDQAAHFAGLQQSYLDAAEQLAQEISSFASAGMSGQIVWGGAAELTKQKLAALPKPERVTFDVAPALSQFKQPSWQLQAGTHNRYLPSATGDFGSDTAA